MTNYAYDYFPEVGKCHIVAINLWLYLYIYIYVLLNATYITEEPKLWSNEYIRSVIANHASSIAFVSHEIYHLFSLTQSSETVCDNGAIKKTHKTAPQHNSIAKVRSQLLFLTYDDRNSTQEPNHAMKSVGCG